NAEIARGRRAGGVEQRREQSLAAAQVEDARAGRDEALGEETGEHRIADELGVGEVAREALVRWITRRGRAGERAERRIGHGSMAWESVTDFRRRLASASSRRGSTASTTGVPFLVRAAWPSCNIRMSPAARP